MHGSKEQSCTWTEVNWSRRIVHQSHQADNVAPSHRSICSTAWREAIDEPMLRVDQFHADELPTVILMCSIGRVFTVYSRCVPTAHPVSLNELFQFHPFTPAKR